MHVEMSIADSYSFVVESNAFDSLPDTTFEPALSVWFLQHTCFPSKMSRYGKARHYRTGQISLRIRRLWNTLWLSLRLRFWLRLLLIRKLSCDLRMIRPKESSLSFRLERHHTPPQNWFGLHSGPYPLLTTRLNLSMIHYLSLCLSGLLDSLC